MKYLSFLVPFAFFGLAVIIFSNFLTPCDNRTSEYSCKLATGQVANIDSAATVTIYDYEEFTVQYLDSNQEPVTKTILPDGSGHMMSFSFITDGPNKVKMLESTRDIVPPLILIDPVNGQGRPYCIVTRTWDQPLTQLYQWYLFPCFMIEVILGIISFIVVLSVVKTKR